MEGCEGFLSDAYASTSKALTERIPRDERSPEAPSSLAEAAACVEATRSIGILKPPSPPWIRSPVRVAGVA